MIELHCHTNASDGTFSPEELVRHAAALSMTHLAITDHDTTAGLPPAQEACAREGILLIPGIELSTRYEEQPVDILGYGIDPDAKVLQEALARVVAARNERIPHIVQRLRDIGIDIDQDMITRLAPGGVVGRPHVAKALVEMGVAGSVKEAFDKFLARGLPGYVPKQVLSMEEAVGLIKQAGGIAVLAHPCFIRLEPAAFDVMVSQLIKAGLSGIEVYYSQHTREQVETLEQYARERGLLATGGSDFHGATKPHIALGMGPEGKPLPTHLAYDLLEAIVASK